MRITDKHLFFWNEYYSQWHLSDFTDPILGITFNCCEQYMMWSKAMLFGDTETAQLILDEKNPREHKKYGRIVKGYDQNIWDANKFNIVYNGNMLKFTQDPKLLFHLLGTGDRTLVEASPKDNIWGIFMSENEEGVDDPKNWKGENLLGYAITDVRNNIRKMLLSKDNLYSIYSRYATN